MFDFKKFKGNVKKKKLEKKIIRKEYKNILKINIKKFKINSLFFFLLQN